MGVAPTSFITSAVATKVNGDVKTVSPGPISAAISDIKSASVPDEKMTQNLVLTYEANFSSISNTSGPCIY